VIADVPLNAQDAGGPWIFDLKTVLEENKNNPHFDLPDYVHKNSKKAIDRGANAVILYNTSGIDDKLVFEAKDKSEKLNGVVVYLKKEEALKYFSNDTGMLHVELKSILEEKKKIGHNVIGYIDNNAATTVILGAHYDHLGYGEDGNSRNTTKEPAIHNGADDNASGTAALIELARKLKSSKAKNNNYLFIAFSGEELGLFGSKYFTEHPTVDLKLVNYMINMDMVGRLNDSTKVLTIGGYGTSPMWPEFWGPQSKYPDLPFTGKDRVTSDFNVKIDSSGTGPSDHTSFYRKDIPVLFYFTGLHSDYHKPTDDADKVNYTGEQKIVGHIVALVENMDQKGKIFFTKTKETQTTTSARFSVSMGIMPDYTYAGTGVRADGVSDNKPAKKAGLQAGDIIIQLGDYNTSSLENYMQALGKFKKGDKVKVKYKRGNEVLETMVEF
jgi:Zn-dependent M28 family amino/carboxypeptidase